MPFAKQNTSPNDSGDDKQPIDLNTWFDNSLAYFIGISNYTDERIPNLKSPKNDIEGLKNVLSDKTKHAFTVKDVSFRDADGTEQTLNNPLLDPNSVQVLNFIRGIQCGPATRVIVYFACHGIAEKTDDSGSPEGFLLATDAVVGDNKTYIRMSDVHDALCNLDCRHLLIILDCCYAGAFRWAEMKRSIYDERPERLYLQKFQQYVTNKARQVITSTSADQQATDYLGNRGESGAEDKPTSPFADCLVRAFSTGEADSRANGQKGDGIISATELGLYLKDGLNNLQLKQIPAVWAIGDAMKGEFVFINPDVTERALIRLDPNRLNPYRGLEAYSSSDKAVYFGRKDAVGELLQIVRNNSVILVSGRSGSGKSSLVKAGVLSNYPKDSVIEIKPGPRPYADNEETLDRLSAEKEKQYCLLVDQYEELVTNCNDEKEAARFEAKLVEICAQHKVILTLRSDFVIQFKNSPLLAERPGFATYVVKPFTSDNFREAVTEVAGRQALEFRGVRSADQDKADERFVNRIIEDASAYPDSLPLFSLALSRLFEKKQPDDQDNMDLLLEDEYNNFKGITGIIEEQAENVYKYPGKQNGDTNDTLSIAERQNIMLQLVFRMISFESAELTKRRVYKCYTRNGKVLNELQFNDDRVSKAARAIADGMVTARLLKDDDDELNNEYIEPAHDALLRSWPRLTEELKKKTGQENIPEEQKLTNQGKAIILRQVSELAREYYFAGDKAKKDLLWIKDYRLDQVMRLKGDDLLLNTIETDFVQQSLIAKQKARKTRYTIISAIFTIIFTALVITFSQYQKAEKARVQAQNQLALSYWDQGRQAKNNDDLLSLLYTSEALVLNKDTDKMPEMLFNAQKTIPLYGLQNIVSLPTRLTDVQLSADGKQLFTRSAANRLQLWDAVTGQEIPVADNKNVSYAAYCGANDIISIQNGQIAIRKDGMTLKKITLAGAGRPQFAHVNTDGKLLSTAAGNRITTWQSQDKVHWKQLSVIDCPFNQDITNLKISSDGRRAFVAGKSLDLAVYDLLKGRPMLSVIADSVATFAVDDDVNHIFVAAASGRDTVYQVMNKDRERFFGSLIINSATSNAVFTPSGHQLIVTTETTATIWNSDGSKESDVKLPPNVDFAATIGSSGGAYLVAHSQDVTKLISLRSGFDSYIFNPVSGHNYPPSWSADGAVIMMRTDSGVYVYRRLEKKKQYLDKFSVQTKKVLFSTDRNYVATVNEDDNYCKIWQLNVDSPRVVYAPFKMKDDDTLLFFDPHGTIIYRDSKVVFLYDMKNKVLRNLGMANIWLNPLGYDGSKLLYASSDQRVHTLWAPTWTDHTLFTINATKDDKEKASPIQYFAYSLGPKNKILLIDTIKGNILIHDIATGKETLPFKTYRPLLGFVPDTDRNWIFGYMNDTSYRSVFFNLRTGLTDTTLKGTLYNQVETLYGESTPVYSSFAISRDGRQLFVFGEQGNYLYNFGSGVKHPFSSAGKAVKYAEFSPNGSLLLVCFANDAKIWDIKTRQWKGKLIKGAPGETYGFSPDGKNILQYVAAEKFTDFVDSVTDKVLRYATESDTINMFDAFTGEKVVALLNCAKASTFLSPDGHKVYVTEFNRVRIIYHDKDIPADLFKLQANVLTGARLNTTTGEVESIPPAEWRVLDSAYVKQARDHLKNCRYKGFNVWGQLWGKVRGMVP